MVGVQVITTTKVTTILGWQVYELGQSEACPYQLEGIGWFSFGANWRFLAVFLLGMAAAGVYLNHEERDHRRVISD